MPSRTERLPQLRAVAVTFLALASISVAAGAVLAATDLKFTWYALWIFSDTGQLQTFAVLGALTATAWLFVAVRCAISTRIAATGTAGLVIASLWTAAREVAASMPMGNSEYIHLVPGTWSLMIAWFAGAGAVLVLSVLIRSAVSGKAPATQ